MLDAVVRRQDLKAYIARALEFMDSSGQWPVASGH
jgi:hypothetical protein